MKFSLAPVLTLATLVSVGYSLPHGLQKRAELESLNARSSSELGWRESDPLAPRSEEVQDIQARGGVADILEEGIKFVVEGFMKLAQAIKQDKIVCATLF